ncbi:MAG: NAD(P)/FAD-dependent oxidoreductase [Patescibacteria group bacterium]|nr:NAD(P)/FAD-dependent oxidoreductase [Patescibacteria group bacterium]
MEKFDVIIIGAGPAGLNCAKHLAKFGKSVLILEKNKIIGKKVCAGGIMPKTIEYLNLPLELLERKFKKICFNARFYKYDIKSNGYIIYTIDRVKLGNWQAKQLENTCVEIRKQSMVTSIENNCVVVNNEQKIKFEYLVGADGASSITRNYLGIKNKKIIIGIQYIIPTTKYKNLEMIYNSKMFHSGYLWIFPYKNSVCIGSGCDPKIFPVKKLKENFLKWLKKNAVDFNSGEFQAHTINYDFQGVKFKNIFLIGDASGMASGLTGEGIHQALISGEEIAKMINNPNYKSHTLKDMIKTQKIHNKVLFLFNKSGIFRDLVFSLICLSFKISVTAKKMKKTFIES